MKTLTPEEILASELGCEIEDIGMAIFHNVQGYVLLKAIKVYHAQFQSQPSISAEAFLKENRILKILKDYLFDLDINIPIEEQGYILIETAKVIEDLFTDFISRNSQGKEVEIQRGEKWICSCGNNRIFHDFNFCPNCGAKIKFI